MGDYMNFLFSPNGRASRSDIWFKYLLASVIASAVAGGLDGAIGMGETGPLGSIVSLFFLWPGIAVSIKRFHDRGMSGWWVLFVYLLAIAGLGIIFWPLISDPAALAAVENGDLSGMLDASPGMIGLGTLMMIGSGLFVFVVNYCLAGDEGPNQYGADPLDPLAGTDSAFD